MHHKRPDLSHYPNTYLFDSLHQVLLTYLGTRHPFISSFSYMTAFFVLFCSCKHQPTHLQSMKHLWWLSLPLPLLCIFTHSTANGNPPKNVFNLRGTNNSQLLCVISRSTKRLWTRFLSPICPHRETFLSVLWLCTSGLPRLHGNLPSQPLGRTYCVRAV